MGRKKNKSKKKEPFLPQKSSGVPEQDFIKDSIETTNFLESSNAPPINIISRLNYPFIEPNENDAISEDEGEDFEFSFRPRLVFAGNLCLVCMEFCDVSASCETCGMVSYCSNEHRKLNLPQHKDLCKILTDVCKTNGGLFLAKNLSPDQYRTFRVKLIEIIEQGLGRGLDLWEKEILLYPRICRKCHGKEDLICCPKCRMAFYCSENHRGDHDQWCDQYQIFRRILVIQKYHGTVIPEIPNRRHKEPYTLPQTLDHLISELFGSSQYYEKMDCHTYASLSYMATVPLTTLFAIQKTCGNWKIKKNFSVHIIGAEFHFECWNLRIWEKMFLHYLPALTSLILTFTGPELQVPPVLVGLLQKVKMCSQCRTSGRSINVTFNQEKLYHEVNDSIGLCQPDVICLFNPGLYRETGFNGRDTWPMTIRKFCERKIPVVITSYTEMEIPQDIERIKSVCDVEVVLQPQKNPFAALKPDRNFVSDDTVPLMYKNNFISIIKGMS